MSRKQNQQVNVERFKRKGSMFGSLFLRKYTFTTTHYNPNVCFLNFSTFFFKILFLITSVHFVAFTKLTIICCFLKNKIKMKWIAMRHSSFLKFHIFHPFNSFNGRKPNTVYRLQKRNATFFCFRHKPNSNDIFVRFLWFLIILCITQTIFFMDFYYLHENIIIFNQHFSFSLFGISIT